MPPITFFNWQAQPYGYGNYHSLSPYLAGMMNWLVSSIGGSNLGGFNERPVTGGSAPSSHAFGAAIDWGPPNRGAADWLINSITSNPNYWGIQAIHDYANSRVWRVGREGDLGGGWQSQPIGSHGGEMGNATHLHFEVNPQVWNQGWYPPGNSNAQAPSYSGGGQITAEQGAQLAYQAGFRGDDLVRVVAIMGRESGYNPAAHNPNSATGDNSYGLMQINMLGSMGPARLRQFGITDASQLLDPLTNLRAAYSLYQQSGLNPWGGYKGQSDTYNTDMAAARSAVAGASTSGLLGQPFRGAVPLGPPGSGSMPFPGGGYLPPGGGFPPGMTPDMQKWLENQSQAAQSYWRQLNRSIGSDINLGNAYSRAQSRYSRKQNSFQQQMLQQQLQGLGFQQQELTLRNQYDQDISRLTAGLTNKQKSLAKRQFQELGRNTARLRHMARQGLQNTRKFVHLDQQLRKDILHTTQKWLGQQRGFNREDLQLTRQSLRNVMQTETQRFEEVQRTRDAERELAGRQRGQALQESAFQEQAQQRQAKSSAVTRGAVTSSGYETDQTEIERQRELADQSTQINFDGQIEQIRQAYQQGRISYQDAVRQTANAQERASLTFRENRGQLQQQAIGARQQYRGATIANRSQLADALLGYQGQRESLHNNYVTGRLGWLGQRAGFNTALRQNQLNSALQQGLYGINSAALRNVGAGYRTQQQMNNSQLSNQLNNIWYNNAQNISGLNNQRMQIPSPSYDPYPIADQISQQPQQQEPYYPPRYGPSAGRY